MSISARNAILAGGAAPGPTPAYWGLCFTAEQANSTVAMVANGSAPSVNLLYSTDAANWSPFVVGTTTVTLASVGDKVWLKAGSGGNTTISAPRYFNKFSLSGLVAASGSVMSLLNGEQETYAFSESCVLQRLFSECTALTTAPTLPATTLTSNCYAFMFNRCTALTTAPTLPATTLMSNCYARMFIKCSSLSSITVDFSVFNPTNATSSWIDGVAANGTFYCPTALGTNETITRGVTYCPVGWTVINTDA